MHVASRFQSVVIGASSGGLDVIRPLLESLPIDFCLSVLVVLHIDPNSSLTLASLLDSRSAIAVKEADEKEVITSGQVYLSPANYHLLVEREKTLTLTVDERVNYARPAIDVLFETAADAFGDALIGIVLTGANSDGALGLRRIGELGGLKVVQDPDTAAAAAMPRAAIKVASPDFILAPNEIQRFLASVHANQTEEIPS